MTLLHRIVLFLWIALLPAGIGFAQTVPSADPLPGEKKALKITADHMIQEADTDIIKARGNVVIRFEDRVLHADQVRINQKTGIGEAKGHVLLTIEDGTLIKSERSLFNMKNKYVKSFDVIGKFKGTDKKDRPLNYYFKGKEIKRFSPVHYKLKDAYVSTCSGKVPDWSFEANTLDVVSNRTSWGGGRRIGGSNDAGAEGVASCAKAGVTASNNESRIRRDIILRIGFFSM